MEQHDATTESLAIKARDGDREAFSALYSRVYPRLYRTALFIVGNTHDAEDVVMGTVADAYGSIRLLRKPESFESWIFKILLNKARRSTGRAAVRSALPLDEEIVAVCEDGAPTSVSRADLARALDRLSRDERAIVAMCVCSDYTSFEAAELLSLNSSTVRSKLARALQKLKSTLGDDFNEK